MWSDFIGTHSGLAYVCGLGDSRYAYKEGRAGTNYGVNDCGRYFRPDYLICVDNYLRFTKERWEYIKDFEARCIFTQLDWKDLPVSRRDAVVKINLNPISGSFLRNNYVIDASSSSVFIAANIALWMGHTTIAVCGSDFKDHHLGKKQNDIIRHWRDLAVNAKTKGVDVVSIVEDSPLNEAMKYVNPKQL